MIREAETWARDRWGNCRFYTYVDPRKVKSGVAGYCFRRAGYKHIGNTKSGKMIFAKEARTKGR